MLEQRLEAEEREDRQLHCFAPGEEEGLRESYSPRMPVELHVCLVLKQANRRPGVSSAVLAAVAGRARFGW
jgi:hypothetical protein